MSCCCRSVFRGCSDDDQQYMIWHVDNDAPENISWNSKQLDGIVYVSINVDANGGDIIMTCENANALEANFSYMGVYDNGWGVFSIEGSKLICHFPKDNSVRQPELEHLTVSAVIDGKNLDTSIRISRTFGSTSTNPDTEDIPDKYTFRFKKTGMRSFVNDEFKVAAPFDLISYEMTDYLDGSLFGPYLNMCSITIP